MMPRQSETDPGRPTSHRESAVAAVRSNVCGERNSRRESTTIIERFNSIGEGLVREIFGPVIFGLRSEVADKNSSRERHWCCERLSPIRIGWRSVVLWQIGNRAGAESCPGSTPPRTEFGTVVRGVPRPARYVCRNNCACGEVMDSARRSTGVLERRSTGRDRRLVDHNVQEIGRVSADAEE